MGHEGRSPHQPKTSLAFVKREHSTAKRGEHKPTLVIGVPSKARLVVQQEAGEVNGTEGVEEVRVLIRSVKVMLNALGQHSDLVDCVVHGKDGLRGDVDVGALEAMSLFSIWPLDLMLVPPADEGDDVMDLMADKGGVDAEESREDVVVGIATQPHKHEEKAIARAELGSVHLVGQLLIVC